MQIPTKRVRQNYNDGENKDILSNLPECVLLHILSFLNTKHTLQTCIILGYIVSHNIQQIQINVETIQHFPPCLFSCHNLTSLRISNDYIFGDRILVPNSLNFPALTIACL
jgi:hypothetical protein